MSVLNRMQALFWPRISLQNLTPNKIGTLSSPGKLSLSSVLFSHLVVSDSLSDSMNHSTPGLPVHHQHPESTQTPVHWVSDAIQTSHPLSSHAPPVFNLSQLQGLFQWVISSHQVAKFWTFRFSVCPSNEYSGLISFTIDWFELLAVQGTLMSLSQHHSSKASILLL